MSRYLLDIACTACMHSRKWRLAYDRHVLRTGSAKRQLALRLSSLQMVSALRPRCGGFGRRGEVLSAEVVTGSTPLLLSVTSMEPLQMDLFLRERRAHIGALGVDVEILQTRAKHRAIDLTKSEGFQIQLHATNRSWSGPDFQICK